MDKLKIKYKTEWRAEKAKYFFSAYTKLNDETLYVAMEAPEICPSIYPLLRKQLEATVRKKGAIDEC